MDMGGATVELPLQINQIYSTGQPGVIALYTLSPERLLGWCLPVSDQEAAYLNPKYLSLPVPV
jgi:iron complex transport system substrate-binding protein